MWNIDGNMLINTLNVSVNMLYFAYFIFTAFKTKIKSPANWTMLISLLVMTVLSAVVTCLFFTFEANYANYGVFAIILWFTLAITILFVIIKSSRSQILFAVFIAVNVYNSLAYVSFIAFNLLPVRLPEAVGVLMVNLIFLILFFPLNRFLMLKLFRNIVELSDLPALKFLWAIPAILYVIFILKFVDGFWLLPQTFKFNDLLGIVLWIAATYIIYCIIIGIIIQIDKNIKVKEQANLFEKQLQMQKEQYYRLSENIKSTAKMRHDFRHHLLTVSGLADNENLPKLKEYIERYSQSYYDQDSAPVCQNMVVDIVLQHYTALARVSGIKTSVTADIPEGLPISDMDLCVVFGNLFENAVEACNRQTDDYRFISIYTKPHGNQLLIEIENSFNPAAQNDGLLSSKHNGEGIGLQSVMNIAQRNDGAFKTIIKDNIFTVNVLINFK